MSAATWALTQLQGETDPIRRLVLGVIFAIDTMQRDPVLWQKLRTEWAFDQCWRY